MRTVVGHALARLRIRPGRALLSAGGIVVVSTMLGAAVTVAASLAGGFDRAAARAHLADVTARFDDAPGALVSERAASLPNVASVALRYTAFGVELRAPEHHVFDARAEGIRPGPRGYAIVAGRDLSGARNEALVERGLARAWRLQPGSTIVVGGFIAMRVVGVAVEPDTVAFPLVGRPRIFVPYGVARFLARAPAGATNELLLWVREPARLDVTLAQARSASYGLRDLRFLTRSGIRIQIGQAAGIVVALLVAFSLVALAAAGAMLAASAASEVQRRLHAIGVLRAVGASPGSIVAGHAVEAALVATPSAAVGVTAGWLVVRGPTNDLLAAINEFGAGPVLAAWLVAAVATIVAVVAAAAAIPAARAAHRRPVDALRGADVSGAPQRAPLPAGPGGLGVRLALARPARSATAVAVLAVSAAFALLILSIATLLSRLESEPQAIGRAYQLSVDAPLDRLEEVRRLAGVVAATPRYDTFASDSFDLGESFEVVAFGDDHTEYEAPPLAEGRRLHDLGEAEVGLGLAQALDLHPGSLLAVQLDSGRETRFRVVGIVRALSQEGRIAYVDPRRLLAAEPRLQPTLAVKAAPGAVASVRAELQRAGIFAASSGGVAGNAVEGWAGRNSGFLSVLVALLRAVAVLDGLVCVYALGQVLALTAVERRQAIAVLRALGAGRTEIARVFAASALVLAAAALPVAVILERVVLGPIAAGLAVAYVSLSLGAGFLSILLVGVSLAVASVAAAMIVARRAGRGPVTRGLVADI
jgi:ABC-type antimicrobial peptide transport system permease subunit